MAFNFDVDTQDILERRRSLTGADLGLGGSAAQPGDRIRPLNMQDIVSIRDQMEPQEIQLAGFDPVQVSSAQYDFIVNHLAGIKDKAEMEAEEIRIASALSYSRNLGLPFQYTLQNLDQIALEWNGIKYSPTATNFRSITDSFKLGTLRNERGTLGTMAMNASTPEELSQILAQSSQLSQQMQALQDSVPRPWYIDLLKMGAENIPYMAAPTMEGIEGYATARLGLEAAARMGGMAVTSGPLRQLGEIGLQATKIGGKLNLPLATALTAYSIYRNFQRGKEINQGNLFLDLLEAGVPADTARPIAGVAGSINQAIEMIGGVDSSWLKAAGIDVDTVASRLLSRMVIRGRLAELGTFAARWGAEAFTEGTEEVFQGIVEGIASDYAYALSGIRNPDAENQESWIKEAADNFAGGFAVSLLLGLPAVAISTHADFQTVKDLRNLSLTVRSKESYDELAAAMRPEDINEADWKTVTDTQYERGKQEGFNAFRDTISQQDLDTTLVDLDPDAEVQSDDEVTGDGQQKVTVDRLSNGKLYGHESRTRWRLPGSFGSGHTFNYGSPETRKSYGAINYTTDSDGHLTITNVRTRAGYENLRQEMVSDFISRFPDMDITWETNSVEEESIRTNLINSNPRGTDYGLNYGRGANAADIQNVRTRIGTLFSEDEATNSALAEIVEMVADREGVTGSEWLDRHIPEFRKWTAEEQAEADAGLPEGYHRTGASEFYDLVDGVKAVVYAGEYANPTTFLHEMTHVLRRIGENGNEFRALFNKVRNDADFQSFVNNSRSIKHKDLSTLFNTEEWTADDDEFFAELGEAYWMSGQTMNNELSGFFSRLTRMFRQIYRALRGTGRLNDEVVSYYDRLYGAGTAENRETPTAAPTTEEAVTNASDSSVASEGTEIADAATSVDGTATPTVDELRKGANEALDDSSDPVVTAEQDPDPAATYTMNASYAVSEWNAAMFRDAFRQKVSNEAVRSILDSIPVALHRAAGLVRLSAGSSITPNDQYTLSPRYENMTEEDAAKMQRNADEYAAAVQKHDERQRGIIADGTVALDYTVNGKTYHMDSAAVDGLGMFTPVEYIEEADLQDNPVRLSINADNVHVEGLEQPDPNVLWKDIPDRTPIMEEDEFADEYDPYESGLDEDGNPLYQTSEDYSPKKIGHGYKLFEQDTRTGKLYPLFIGSREETPVGTWMIAQNIPTKGFANRPGWHIGSSLPDAPWLKGYSADNPRGVFNSKRGKNFRRVWAEVSYPMDVDYQEELDRRGIRDIKDHTPENGYYTFREANGTWIIAGALRVDRILSEDERQQIFNEAGYDEQAAWENSKDYAHRRRQYEERVAREEGRQLFQTVEDITSSAEWQETEVRLRANAANFDEAGRPLAPNGQLSQLPYREWVTVRTPSFINWFGDWMNDPENASKVVDENGEPMIMYHGSPNEFSAFDPSRIGETTDSGFYGIGFYFSPKFNIADGYGNTVYPAFLNLRKPFDRAILSEPKYDSQSVDAEADGWYSYFYNAGKLLEDDVLFYMYDDDNTEFSAQEFAALVDELARKSSTPFADAIKQMHLETLPEAAEELDVSDSMLSAEVTKYAKTNGYDGIIVDDEESIVFNPEAIKSINNRGTFSSESNDILYQLSPEYVRENMDYETKMPTDEAFLDAVRNTPGASIVDDGIIIDLERWQRPEQDNEASVRTGVFYLPRGASQSRYYRGGTGFYGGPVHFTGETLLKAPLAVKGATGGNVPLKAYEALFGKEAAKKLEEDCESIMRPYQRSAKANRAMDVYYEYLPYADDDYMDFSTLEINSREGNQLRYAVQENIIAHAVREAGYDSVVGFNRGKITEVFDVREAHYPSETSNTPWATYTPEAQTLYQTQAEKKRIDSEYFAALDRGDMETAQRIVDNQARLNGYITDDDYRMMHQAPYRDKEGFNKNILDLANGSDFVPADYWTHPEWYGIQYETGGWESFGRVQRAMQRAKDLAAKGYSEERIRNRLSITMYRAVPADVKEDDFRNGDWITPSRQYAELHGRSNINGPYRIITKNVLAKNVYWNADSINEWGYDDGKSYAYRNTKNNRKLTDTVVRDYDGNIVPPSQRFNYRKWETFFQTMTDEAQAAYVEAAQTFAIENHEALFQTMDFGDSEELRGYFAQMIKEAANYTDYDEFHAVAEWIYPDDEMVERAWRVAKNPDEGSDNTGAMPKKTLARPDLSASSEDAKDAEFIEIISTDEGFNEWLNAIMQACRDVDSENTRAVYEAVDREEVAPLIRNLVFPRRRWVGVRRGGYDFAARDEKTHAKAIASAKGILRANPSFYRDLYARATETDFWISTYGDRIPQDIINEAPEEFASLSASGRQKLAERIRNERLRRSILAGSEKYDPSQVRSLIKQQDDAIAAGQLEVKRLEDELNKLGRKYGDAQSARFRLWNQITEKDAEISAAQQRLTDISNRIAAHSRRDFGDDGSVSQRLVDQQQKLASQISELVKQQNSYLRQLKNEAVSDAVREQYDKDLARMRDIRQKRDEKLQALRDRYRERDALRAVNRHKEELAEIIMREPSKNVDLEEADKIRAIQALLDPAFRRGMRVNGQTWDIDTLKAMFRGETERDPVVFGALTEEQLTRLSKKDLNEWTLEELEEMATAVRALRKQGLQRRQMKVDAERARIQRYRDAAMSTIIGSGNYKEPPTSGSTEKREEDRSFLNRMRSIYYSTINWARKSQILDGTSNHNPDKSRMYNATIGRTTTGHKGVFYDLLVRMKRDAESEEFRMMTERMKPVRDYIKAHKINEDSFYEKFTIDIDGRKQTYRYSDLVYIYLSQNNPRNRDAVAYGEFVSQYEKDTIKRDVEDEIIGAGRKENAARSEEINNRIREIGDARYESVLRQAESIIKDESRRDLFEVVRLIEADFNSGLFDRLRRAMAETYNIRVEKEAYYLPINRTDFAGSEPGEVLKQDLMNMIPDNGSVQRGFTKDRQDISPYWQKPINIDFFNVWQQSVYNQEHALSHIDYVRLLKGVFQNKGSETLRAVISSSYGQTMVQSIKDHINQIANPQSFTKKSGGDSLLRFLRGSLYSSYLGFKASSVVLQAITSPAPYLGAVNPLELAQGYFTVLRNPIQMWEEIQRLSPFMATRSYHPIIEWMKTEAQRGDLSKVRRTVMRVEDFGMQGLELVDRYAVAGGWWAIYTKERNRLLNEGNLQTEAEIEKAAAKVADEFVQETQPQSNITELSPMFQNRNEAMAILTQFQASLNVVWQNVTYDVPQAIKNGQYAKAIGMITGYVVAGALLYMVQQGFDDDDDNKEKMQKLLYGMTTQITSGVPLVSDLVDSTVETIITGETSNFFSSSSYPAFDKLMKAVQNTAKQNYGKAMENLTDSMLLFTGFPYSGGKEALRLFGIGDEDGKLGFYPGEIVGRRHE